MDIDPCCSTKQTVEVFADDATNDAVAVLFQVVRLAKQAYIYIGLADDRNSSLRSMSMGLVAGQAPISTVILPSLSATQNNDTESQQLAQMLCRKAGVPVLVSYNIPPGSVTDAVKSKICRHAASELIPT